MNDRWERLIDLYHSAVMLPADERATLLAEECGDDSALQADIERMITAHHRVSRPTGVSPVIDAAKPPEPIRPLGAASSQPTTPPPITTDGEGQATGVVTEPLDGQSIDTYADERQLSVTERLELFLLVCSAITNARRRGVAYGELTSETIHVSALGTPKLPDAGLGDDVATPATDISSLGIVLDRL